MLKEVQKNDTTMFSEKVMELYMNKVNVGALKDANLIYTYTGPCGDTIKLYLKVNGEITENASFECSGCIASYACTSILTELIKGKTLKEAQQINEAQILKELGGLPESHMHCTRLAVTTLHKAIEEYEKNERKMQWKM